MMKFKKRTVFKEPQYCRVCRKKVYEGKTLGGYEKFLSFVCNDCFEKYFAYTSKLEESEIAVGLRPSDIYFNEYRIHYITASQIVRDMAVWLAVSFLTFLVSEYTDTVFYSGFIACPLPQAIIFSVMAGISFFVFLKTAKDFVSGMLKGMNHLRRFLLFAKSAEFLAVGIFAANYILRR